jgi:hypothetical protein
MSKPMTAAQRKQRATAGCVTSPAKTASCQANGKRGGRPGNPEVTAIMAEKGCSRQWARIVWRDRLEQAAKEQRIIATWLEAVVVIARLLVAEHEYGGCPHCGNEACCERREKELVALREALARLDGEK